ncbi:carboxylesterase [Ramlibacter tataouinensis]|uniref:Carboxylesterase n=1 Tax=Ramlibacter tataouinensis TaxID=94132 RepID=A0A127K1S4_9BURK|nr:carboxylesterase [Ramlibacter tataouinensis]
MTRSLRALTYVGVALAAQATWAQNATPSSPTVAVTAENFVRAESDRYFSNFVRQGAFGKFIHYRDLLPIDKITVVRVNRDTLYSFGVFDLDAGPVTVTLPDAGKRYMSMVTLSEDQNVSAATYGAGTHVLTKEKVGTRYVVALVRTLLDPASAEDRRQANALQDGIQSSQAAAGRFEVPNWDQASLKKMREALMVLGATYRDTRGMFGTREQVTPVRQLIGAAIAWGGLVEKDALYEFVNPSQNDGATTYRLKVKDVPVDSFWSISVYNAEGWFIPNKENAYTINNITAKRGADGSVAVQFGGCDGTVPNCLPITQGWNYMVRLYRPRAEILNGQWRFPEAQPAARP